MKKKYYLRGLGFGILITTLVFILVGNNDISDEEVIRRAEELGYEKVELTPTTGINLDALRGTITPGVTRTPLPSITPEPTSEPEPSSEPTKEPTPTSEPTKEPEPSPEPTKEPTPLPTPEPTKEPEPSPTPTNVPTKAPEEEVVSATIQVRAGMTSTQVCKLIAEAGIVDDWSELNQYMISAKLTDYINVGTFVLSSDMSKEEIGHVLTGR